MANGVHERWISRLLPLLKTSAGAGCDNPHSAHTISATALVCSLAQADCKHCHLTAFCRASLRSIETRGATLRAWLMQTAQVASLQQVLHSGWLRCFTVWSRQLAAMAQQLPHTA